MTRKNDGPFQIKRIANPEGGFDYHLIQVTTGKLVCGDYRCKSIVPPLYLRQHQARLNTEAMLDYRNWL